MAAAAVPYIMLATAVAGTVVSYQQSKAQTAIANRQADEQSAQIEADLEQQSLQIQSSAKDAEIERLERMRYVLADNIVSTIDSGATLEGTPMDIIESNIANAREDISMIQSNAEAGIISSRAGAAITQAEIEIGRKATNTASKYSQFGTIISGIGSGAAGYSQSGGF